MSGRTELINGIFEVERAAAENAGKVDIALRTEIARRMVAESTPEELAIIQRTIDAEFAKEEAKVKHLEEASETDPAVQEK